MAKVRGITKQMLTDVKADIRKYEVLCKQGEQHNVAEKLMQENPNILYCNYWNDKDLEWGGQLTYSITREDCEYHKKMISQNDDE